MSDDKVQKHRLKQRQKKIEEVDADGVVDAFDKELVQRVSRKAWGSSPELKEYQEGLVNRRFSKMNYRDKVKAVVGFLLGVAESQEFQEEMTNWALNNPGDVMKMIISMAPKEAEITHTHEGGVVLLIGKMDSIEDWQKEIAGQTLDGEVNG